MDITPYWANRAPATVTLASGAVITVREQDERIERNRARNTEIARLRELRRTTRSFQAAADAVRRMRGLMAEREEI